MAKRQLKVKTAWFRFAFKCKNHLVHKFTLMMGAAMLLLAFLNVANMMNFVAAPYAIGSTLLGRLDDLKNAAAIAKAACAYDFLYLVFHSSSSSWITVKILLATLHFCVILFDVIWITSMHCYVNQQTAIAMSEEKKEHQDKKLAWCEGQIKIRPCGPAKSLLKRALKTGLDVAKSMTVKPASDNVPPAPLKPILRVKGPGPLHQREQKKK